MGLQHRGGDRAQSREVSKNFLEWRMTKDVQEGNEGYKTVVNLSSSALFVFYFFNFRGNILTKNSSTKTNGAFFKSLYI